jgi:hypothetical protein
VLDVLVPPWGCLQSGKADPDLGCPRELAGGIRFFHGLDVLDIAGGGVVLLDPYGLELEELTSREQR